MDSSIDEIKELVKSCLNELYRLDEELFRRNRGKGVSERSIVFRFAHYLQNRIGSDFFVDCDFNSSKEGEEGTGGKPILNQDRTKTKRFIDVIVHKRELNNDNNLVCFEFKKWNNTNRKEIEKDRNNLHKLTLKQGKFGYSYGFHITIHKVKSESKWTIYENGDPIQPEQEKIIFGN